jgi:predicted nucleic acid-binding protein
LIFVDSSAWISYFNGAPDAAAAHLAAALDADRRVCLIDLVVTEVLQGFRQDREFELARRALTGVHRLALSHACYVQAARLYRRLRLRGLTPTTIDCIIAQACLDAGTALLTKDADFEGIAQHTRLRLFR